MSVTLLYVDLRINSRKLLRCDLDSIEAMEASEVVRRALGEQVLNQIQTDLTHNNKGLIISWTNKETEEHSDIGGVDSLDWIVPDKSILSVVYEDETADEMAINLSNEWMLKNYSQ